MSSFKDYINEGSKVKGFGGQTPDSYETDLGSNIRFESNGKFVVGLGSLSSELIIKLKQISKSHIDANTVLKKTRRMNDNDFDVFNDSLMKALAVVNISLGKELESIEEKFIKELERSVQKHDKIVSKIYKKANA